MKSPKLAGVGIMAIRATSSERSFHFVDSVPVGRVFLALDNPRHEPVETEPEAIERLCADEDVLPLARDIVRHGLSPLERFALTPIGKTKSGDTTYWVSEGNRRICALKLLCDPDLAPPKLRKSFEKIANGWSPIKNISAVVFRDLDVLRVWLDRVHSGPQNGVGRKTWDSDQKQRFFGGTKNKIALAVLDYAESEKMITKEERQGKLTTAQRFLNPEVFREVLGIDRSNPDELYRNRPKNEFDILLNRFIKDLIAGTEVNSRKNKADVIKYARRLGSLPEVTTSRIEPEALSAGEEASQKRRTRHAPRKPEKARHVRFEDDIYQALRSLGNHKLESLYYSICFLELDRHTPLVCIGAWAFFETLTACQGRGDNVSFEAFLSKAKLTALGIAGDTVSLRSAITRMREYGNSTKHHPVSATFNGDQLNNDMTALKDVILKCINEASGSS